MGSLQEDFLQELVSWKSVEWQSYA